MASEGCGCGLPGMGLQDVVRMAILVPSQPVQIGGRVADLPTPQDCPDSSLLGVSLAGRPEAGTWRGAGWGIINNLRAWCLAGIFTQPRAGLRSPV